MKVKMSTTVPPFCFIHMTAPSYLIVIAVISPCSSSPGPLEDVGPAASVLTSEVEGKVAMVASVLPLLSMKTGTRILVFGYSGACVVQTRRS